MRNLKKTALVLFFTVFYHFLNSNLFCQANPEGNIIRINSYPQGASVYINNKFSGTTPLQVFNSENNDLRIKAELNGVSREQTIGFVKGIYEVFFVLDGDYGILDIKSKPDSAEVYLNDTKIGLTPLEKWKLHLGNYKLSIKKKDYTTVENIIFVRSTKYDFNVNLKLNYSLISIDDKSINKLRIDDKIYTCDSMGNYKIAVGKHNFELKPEAFFRPIDKDFDVKGGNHYRLTSSYGYYTPKYLLMSAVVPGLGQFLDKSHLQGLGYFLGTLAGSIFYFKAGGEYTDYKTDFDRYRDSYFGAQNETDAIKYRALLESSLNDMNKAAKRKNLFIEATLGIYFLNLIDTVVFHSEGSDMQLDETAEISAGANSLGFKIKF